MTHWKSYHLLGESFADTGNAPASLLRWAVERVVHGFIRHEDYSVAVAHAATRPCAMQRAERLMRLLMALDANPVASLMRTAADIATFQRRWNGFNRMAPLGVTTQFVNDPEPGLRREARAAGLHDDMRGEIGALCIAHLAAARDDLHPPDDAVPRLYRLVGELAHTHTALRDSIDTLCANPLAELGDCALATGCARRTLQRAFADAGLSFRLLRQAVRLSAAEQALREGGSSLTEIAHASGFFDSAHFTHAWQQSCGLTPSQYRSLC
jgi:AraC-like DNA-binding protein